MSLKAINQLDAQLSNNEKFICLASNPCYITDEVFLNSWMKDMSIDVEHESEYVNQYDQNGPKGETALLRAVRTGNLDFIVFLIKSGADVNHVSLNGTTPLMLAAYYSVIFEQTIFSKSATNELSPNGLKVIDLLIKSGADINMGDVLGFWNGPTDNESFEYILDNIKNVNQVQYDGSNHFTSQLVKKMSLEQYKKLHQKGLDIHCINKNNHNPIFSAAVFERMEIVEYLLGFNVDLNVVSIPFKKNVLDYLESKKQFEVLNFIKSYPLYNKLINELKDKKDKNLSKI